MSNLEAAISAWRKQLLAAHLSPKIVDELESHLRDDLEGLIHSGMESHSAFQTAVDRLGIPEQLQTEFKKMNSKNHLTYWPHAVLFLIAAFFVALNIWVGEGLNVFAPVYCLLLCLSLPLIAGPQPITDQRLARPWFRSMLSGQLLIGLGALAVIFSPLHPAFGLSFAIISCALFINRLRQISRAGLTTPTYS